MNIRDLIQELEYIQEEYGDIDVRIAQQPSWPFEYEIGNIVTVDLNGPSEEQEEMWDEEDVPIDEREIEGEAQVVAYIGEQGQIGYLPGIAKDALGWSGR